MTKTKLLSTNDKLPEAMEPMPKGRPEENEIGTTPSSTRTIKSNAILPELHQALITYLGTKPLNEVENLVVALRNAPLIDLTITENAKPN